MAITVDWPSQVFTVPKADTTLVDAGPPEIRQFDVNDLMWAMREATATEAGVAWPETHNNTGEYTLSGFTYARGFEIINGYTVTFEDGTYVVNLFGANHNILDVATANQVSLLAQNSAGLLVGAAAEDVWSHTQASSITALNSRTDTL